MGMYFWGFMEACAVAGLLIVVVIATSIQSQMRQKRLQGSKEPTPFILAQLARAVYLPLHKAIPLNGWVRHDRVVQRFLHEGLEVNERMGAVIDVFVCGDNLVLSVRGTDPVFLGDLSQDSKLFADRLREITTPGNRGFQHDLPTYVPFLLAAMNVWGKRYPHHRKYLTGHSLGASCCEAAWASDLAMKVAESSYKDDEIQLDLWTCMTWESPGFAVPVELQHVLDTHQDDLYRHVIHYLGAPNVVNCLHPHISPSRRYRIHLTVENELTIWHVLNCIWLDAAVILNWISIARCTLSLASRVLVGASEKLAVSSTVTLSSHCPTNYWEWLSYMIQCQKEYCWSFCNVNGVGSQQLFAVGTELQDYADWLGKAENITALPWLQRIAPTSSQNRLTWAVINRNALLQGQRAVDYLLQQHSLCNMIDSFDSRNGFPIKCVHMESWPTMADMVSGSIMESIRSMVVMPSLQAHIHPSVKLENSVRRLTNYKEARVVTAQVQVLREEYNYLGEAFFDEQLQPNSKASVSLADLEFACREEYKRIGRCLPRPVYLLRH